MTIPIIIAIAGGTGSGKSALAYTLKDKLGGHRCDVIPDYKREDISNKESIVVIFNRAIEQLNEIFGDKKEEMTTQTYQICKGYVNLASSILIAEGKYEPLYKEMLPKLDNTDYTLIPFAFSSGTGQADLMEKIRKWMDFKLNPKEDLLFKSRSEVLKRRVGHK